MKIEGALHHDFAAGAVTERAREGFIAVHQLAIRGAPVDASEIAHEKQTIAFLGAAQSFFAGAAVGDIVHESNNADNAAVVTDQRRVRPFATDDPAGAGPVFVNTAGAFLVRNRTLTKVGSLSF